MTSIKTQSGRSNFVKSSDSRLSNERKCDNTFNNAATARSNLGVDLATASRQCNNNFDNVAVARSNLGAVSNTDARLTDSRKCNNTFDNVNTAKSNLGLNKITQPS